MKTLTLCLITAGIISTALAGDIVIYPTGFATNTGPNCIGGTYAGYANYLKPISQGWGWAPDTNNFTTFTATYTNNPLLNLQSVGKSGDLICSPTNFVQIANPPYSSKYRFTIYFHSVADIPHSTNDAGLVLHNFLP